MPHDPALALAVAASVGDVDGEVAAAAGALAAALLPPPPHHPGGPGPLPPPPPPSRTKWTRRVPHPVLIGHASSHPPVLIGHASSHPPY